ncbi:hypothetical protein [Saccharopolyspora shandongensis]|uniref:hypothetical protein n=1 Tax=Saccharopolyspora shandongensis TaxID=418495 RepID=UPI003401B810
MCRLFGLSAAPKRVQATFWLLEAPDRLTQQSRREPDRTGLDLSVTRRIVVADPPRRPLSLADLDAHAAASQA